MEKKINAIVLRSIDYKDNDKILTLYSLECGKIVAGIKGVKRFGAKLKFAQEPFCFAEFIINEKGGRNTVINATFIDNFYNLRLSIEKYYTVAVVNEILLNLVEEEMPDDRLFSLSINAIKDICYKENERLTLAKYLKDIIEILGYNIQNPYCFDCGCQIENRVFFDFKNANFYCQECRVEGVREIKTITYDAYFKLCDKSQDFNKEEIDLLLRFLTYYLEYKTESKLKSADNLLKMV